MKALSVLMAILTVVGVAHGQTRFLAVDSFDTSGRQLSLDSSFYVPKALPELATDAVFVGYTQTTKFGFEPVSVVLPQKTAWQLGLVQDPKNPSLLTLTFTGRPVLADGKPLQVLFLDRMIPGTRIARRIGRTPDGLTLFSGTDDPVPIAIVVAVALTVGICGAITYWETSRNDCIAQAAKQCGLGRVSEINRRTIMGVAPKAKENGYEFGCDSQCQITCK